MGDTARSTGAEQVELARERAAFAVSEREWSCVPSPLVSRDRAVTASSGDARALVRRTGSTERRPWRPDAGAAWVAVQVGVGPARVLVRLEAPAGERLPPRYRIESSAGAASSAKTESPRSGSTDAWRLELEVAGNTARTRVHGVEFDGQSAVKVTFDAEEPGGVALGRLDVFDASDGSDDVWLVLGDELAQAGLAEDIGGFADGVHARYPGYFPALIDESRPGDTPAAVLGRLGPLLALHPEARRVALGFGATPGGLEVAPLAELAAALLSAGRVPSFARAPRLVPSRAREVAAFNAALELLEREHGLVPGPQPCAWAERFRGALQGEARAALAALWVEAADVFYVPQ